MGGDGVIRTDEDELCAIYMKNRLEGRRIDPNLIISLILGSDQVLYFADPEMPHFHPEDIVAASSTFVKFMLNSSSTST